MRFPPHGSPTPSPSGMHSSHLPGQAVAAGGREPAPVKPTHPVAGMEPVPNADEAGEPPIDVLAREPTPAHVRRDPSITSPPERPAHPSCRPRANMRIHEAPMASDMPSSGGHVS